MAIENQVTFAEVGNPKRVTQLTENTDAAGAYFLTEKVGETAAKKTSYATVESAVKSKVQSEYLQALSATPASDKTMSEKLVVGELKKRDDKIVQLEQDNTVLQAYKAEIKSKNLLNYINVQNGYINWNNGEVGVNDSLRVSLEYFRLELGKDYSMLGVTQYAIYDSNRLFVRGVNVGGGAHKFTAANNEMYIRCSFNKDTAVPQLQQASTIVDQYPYHPVIVDSQMPVWIPNRSEFEKEVYVVKETIVDFDSINICPPDGWNDGYYVNNIFGSLSANSKYSASPFFKAKANTTYYQTTGTELTDDDKRWAAYDRDQKFISGGTSTLINTPPATAFIRVTSTPSMVAIKKIMVHEGNSDIPFVPYTGGYGFKNISITPENLTPDFFDTIKDRVITPIKCDFFEQGNNLFDISKASAGMYINTDNGTAVTGYADYASDFIPIDSMGLFCNVSYIAGTSIGHAVYDVNKVFIRGIRSGGAILFENGDSFVRFSMKGDMSKAMINKGLSAMPYEPYKLMIPDSLIKKDSAPNQLDLISLPDKIYAVVGDTLQLFYRGIVKANNPYDYNVLVSCSKGNQYPRYFEYIPKISDIGSATLSITLKDNTGNIICSKTCMLITKDAVKSPLTTKNIICLGDSLTSAGGWCREADRRLTETGGTPEGKGFTNIKFCGSKKNSTTGYFGVGGWQWSDYTTAGRSAYRFQVTGVTALSVGATYTNNGNTFTIAEVNVTSGSGNILCSVSSLTPAPSPSGTLTKTSGNGDVTITYSSVAQDSQNPLWDYSNNKMTFIPYANTYCSGQIDAVYTLLSWNGQTAWRTDFTSVINEVKKFADTLHAEFPNAKLKIMGLQVCSVTGGMGSSYGATGDRYADQLGMVVTALNQNKAYQDFANLPEYSSFVEFVNVSAQFDSEYNMPYEMKAVNARSHVTEIRGTNGVHPSEDGYKSIGDVVYRNIIANFCQ